MPPSCQRECKPVLRMSWPGLQRGCVRWLEEQLDVGEEGALVLFDQDQVVPAPLQHLLADRALAIPGIAGENPPALVEGSDDLGDHGELCLRFGGRGRDRHLAQHNVLLVAEGGERVNHPGRRVGGEPSALSFAIDGHALAAAPRWRGNAKRTRLAQHAPEPIRVEFGEEALEGRLMRGTRGSRPASSGSLGDAAGRLPERTSLGEIRA